MCFEAQAPYPIQTKSDQNFKKKERKERKKKRKKMSRLWSLRDLTFLYPGQETTKHGYTT